ncbi:unnamed protein product, partial [marine sediment metagenome]
LDASKYNPKGVIETLEELKVECPKCKGVGFFPLSKERVVACPRYTSVECPKCNGKGKVHYSHSPQVGEWLFIKTRASKYKQPETLHLITSVYQRDKLIVSPQTLDMVNPFDKAVIFILEWEEIVTILEKAGILLRLRQTPSGWMPPTKFYCDVTILHRDAARVKEFISLSVADSRTKAVYDAVLELKKEIIRLKKECFSGKTRGKNTNHFK